MNTEQIIVALILLAAALFAGRMVWLKMRLLADAAKAEPTGELGCEGGCEGCEGQRVDGEIVGCTQPQQYEAEQKK